VRAFGSTHGRFRERKGAKAKARELSGLKPPLALSPPPRAEGSTRSTERRIGDHEQEIPRQRLDNQEAGEGIRCSWQSLGLGVDGESRTVEASPRPG
jgi:hypothetical protein